MLRNGLVAIVLAAALWVPSSGAEALSCSGPPRFLQPQQGFSETEAREEIWRAAKFAIDSADLIFEGVPVEAHLAGVEDRITPAYSKTYDVKKVFKGPRRHRLRIIDFGWCDGGCSEEGHRSALARMRQSDQNLIFAFRPSGRNFLFARRLGKYDGTTGPCPSTGDYIFSRHVDHCSGTWRSDLMCVRQLRKEMVKAAVLDLLEKKAGAGQ